jgi:predicted phage gp36 major capsid-like protein
MTTADKIRALLANDLTDAEIAEQVGCTRRRVYLVRYEDDNRDRIRELRAKWNRKARMDPEYKAAELAAQRDRYVASVGGYVRPYKRRERDDVRDRVSA